MPESCILSHFPQNSHKYYWIWDFDEAIQPSLADIGEKLKELGNMLKQPAEDLSAQFKEWSKSVKPTLDDLGKRVKSLGKDEDK